MKTLEGNAIHFISLGCARNLVDTEVMLGITLKAGFEISADIENSDYVVVNTCGFLEASRQEALDVLDEVFEYKKKQAKVIVVGCMVNKHKAILQEHFPNIDSYLGAGDVDKILLAINDNEKEFLSDGKSYLQQGQVPRVISSSSRFAYLKIAEGCKKQCAFCIIPKIKGKLKSKTVEQVVKEFHALLDQGIFEVILIAQDLGDFGKDRKEKNGLATLLRELINNKRNFWLRLLYLYPDEIDDEIISIIKSDKRICRYLDMPIQHINDDMLKSMHRKTSKSQIISIITKLRKEIPDIVIRTSLMVGFPGETPDQFSELLEFVNEFKLDNIGFFSFSREKDSYAFDLENQIPEEVKQSRLEKIANLQKNQVDHILSKYIGKKLDVLIEGYHPDSDALMRGRFYGQCPEIDGQVILNDTRNVTEFGQVYEVEITDTIGYDLLGSVTRPLKSRLKEPSPLVIV